MSKNSKTRDQLLEELDAARERIAQLELAESQALSELKQLRDQSSRVEDALKQAGAMVLDWDTKTGDFSFYRHWVELLGFSTEDFRPNFLTWRGLIDGLAWHDGSTWPETFLDDPALSPWGKSQLMKTASGYPVMIQARDGVIERDEGGEPKRATLVFLDVTAQEMARDRLRPIEARTFPGGPRNHTESERSYRETGSLFPPSDLLRQLAALGDIDRIMKMLFDSRDQGIFIKDVSMRYIAVNSALARMTGMAENEFVGRSDDELREKYNGVIEPAVIEQVMRGESVQFQNHITLNGYLMNFRQTLIPKRSSDWSVCGIYGIVEQLAMEITESEASPPRNEVSPKSGSIPGEDYIGEGFAARSRSFHVREVSGTSNAEFHKSGLTPDFLKKARLAAEWDTAVLLRGESGSGKDFLANYIHKHSKRSCAPFFSINCAAVSRELAESELFGHEPGAFTGAKKQKKGLLELAEGGTLLLNEIGEASLSIQSKLLSFLDTHEILRVGGEKKVNVNARLIAATNRDLKRAFSKGSFREDLYHRLNVFSITVPPLRERLTDLPVLVEDILSKLKKEMRLPKLPKVDPASVKALFEHSWPGNIRELSNTLERAIIMSGGNIIKLNHISFDKQEQYRAAAGDIFNEESEIDVHNKMHSRDSKLPPIIRELLERDGKGEVRIINIEDIIRLYEECKKPGWKNKKIAAVLGLDRSTISKYWSRPDFKKWKREHGEE